MTWCRHCGEDIEYAPMQHPPVDWVAVDRFQNWPNTADHCSSSPDGLHHPAREERS